MSFGVMIAILGIVVIIPLCSLVVYSAHMSFSDFIRTITMPRVVASYKVSFITALIASLINLVMGLILAWVLVRYDFPFKRLMDGMIELPFALPTAVAGIALIHLTVSDGWVGKLFDNIGIKIAYTRIGIMVALVFIGIPFVVRSVQPVLEKLDTEIILTRTNKTSIRIIFKRLLSDESSCKTKPAITAAVILLTARPIPVQSSGILAYQESSMNSDVKKKKKNPADR